MSDKLIVDKRLIFDESETEWVVEVGAFADSTTTPYIFLKRVWLSSEIANTELFDDSDAYQESLLETYLESNSNYVRTILPSEIGEHQTVSSFKNMVKDMYPTSGSKYHSGVGKTGYFLYVDNSLEARFDNYDLALRASESIDASVKAHNDLYLRDLLSDSSQAFSATVVSTYPRRTVVGGKVVSGCVAGDKIRFRLSGGAGNYTNNVDQSGGMLEVVANCLRVKKNVSDTVVLTFTDTGAEGDTVTDTITIQVGAIS